LSNDQDDQQARQERAIGFQKQHYKAPQSALGYVLSRESFEELTGRHIHPKAFDLSPVGARIHVAVDPKKAEHRGIAIPHTAVQEFNFRGWIIAAGNTAHLESTYPSGACVEKPEDLLGLHIYFGHAGQPMRLDFQDTRFEAPLRVLTSRDNWFIDTAPWNDPWEMEE